jgi:hypothetical protein
MIGKIINMKYKIHYKGLDQAFDFEAFKEKVENFYNSLKWVENLDVRYYNIVEPVSDRNRSLMVRYHNNTLDNYLDKEVMIEIRPLKQEITKVNYPTLQPTLLMKDELKFFDLLDFELFPWNNAQDITDWFGMEDEV